MRKEALCLCQIAQRSASVGAHPIHSQEEPDLIVQTDVITLLPLPAIDRSTLMSDTLKIRKVGNSRGIILPQPLLEEMGVEEGDELFAVREADGSLRLTPYDPDFADAVEDAREFMDSHRNAFRELAE